MEFEILDIKMFVLIVCMISLLCALFILHYKTRNKKLTLRKKVNNFYGLCGWEYSYIEIDSKVYFDLFCDPFDGYKIIKINGKDVN